MKLDIYVNYRGVCEQAFRFYEQHLGGKITSIMTFKQLPDPTNVPEGRENDILHATIEIGDTVLRGADIPYAEPMRSAYLTLRVNSAEEAERIYTLLSEGGETFMPMEETFFALRFAQLRDRFGTSWMLMCEHPSLEA
ncbi:VOC family protein [Bacillus sp. DNRA2]|uniref:VOC family protein n=1 Tax=Bacillus sp. DNRA2 TaxID=2723053 RepID=UPI00145F8A87|nr:VOC family protein [Bacillus sp. DNRA2]NMD72640.1 VOC family protein [Bacillus sp. DNRA2]